MRHLEKARQLHRAGFFVIPIRLDGSKSPTSISWAFYKERSQTAAEIESWFKNECGLAIVGGPCSNNVEFMDFETTSSFEEWRQQIESDRPDLFAKLVLVRTPGSKFFDDAGRAIPGIHVYYRVDGAPVPGSMELAKKEKDKAFIETRGNGGYVVIPDDPRVHPSGKPYEWIQGSIESISTITWEERDLLISTAESLNEYVEDEQIYRPQKVESNETGSRPGDIFNAQGDWQFLENYGWKLVSQRGAYCKWRRPGKTTKGISATTGYCKGKNGNELFYNFSSSGAPFQQRKAYDRFATFTILQHGGDFSAAASALRTAGFRQEQEIKPNEVDSTHIEATKSIIVNSVNDFLIQDSNSLSALLLEEISLEGWEPPNKLYATSLPIFPVKSLPSLIAEYCSALAESSQTPVDLAVQLSLANLSGSLAGRIRVTRNSDHSEPLNIWTLTALASANRKSSVFREVFKPAGEVELELALERKPEIAEKVQQKRMLVKLKERAEKTALKSKLDEETREEARKQALDLAKKIDDFVVPAIPRFTADDCTTEKLASMLAEQQGRMVIATPEPSFLENCKGRYSDNVNCEVYLQGHAGDTIRVDRVNRSTIIVPDPRLTIACAVQPSVLTGLGKVQELRGRGFLARFLYAIPPSKIGKRLIEPEPIPTFLKSAYHDLSCDLWRGQLSFKDGRLVESELLLSPEANESWVEFSHHMERRMDAEGDLVHITDWAGKLAGAVLRIAGMLHVVTATIARTNANDPISGPTMDSACQMAREYWIAHALGAFSLIYGNPNVEQAERIVMKVRTNPGQHGVVKDGKYVITRREIQRILGPRCPQSKDVDPIINLLLEHDYLRSVVSTPVGKGRPSSGFFVNPHVIRNPDRNDINHTATQMK